MECLSNIAGFSITKVTPWRHYRYKMREFST